MPKQFNYHILVSRTGKVRNRMKEGGKNASRIRRAETYYYKSKDRERFVKLNKKDSVNGLELHFKHKDGSVL